MLWWVVVWSCRVDGSPLVEARGGGAGFWPPHSATAVEGSIALAIDGFEVDVTPTADGEWVLQGGLQWQDCIDVRDGVPPSLARVAAWEADEAFEFLRCGGTPDPQRPNALVVEEPPLGLVQLTRAVRRGDAPDQHIHLHLRLDEPEPDVVRSALQDWVVADLPNPLHVSTDDLDTLRAVRRESRILGRTVETTLRLAVERSPSAEVGLDRALWQNLVDAGADGVAIPLAEHTGRRRRAAERHGLDIMILGSDRPGEWPSTASSGLSDYPGDRP